MHTLSPWPFATPEPGVYFNMPFSEYLAIPALSNSGIKALLVSGPNFWEESWLNPFRVKVDKIHHKTGRAYHKRILEGRAAFYAEYGPAFEDNGDPDILRGNDAMIAALETVGVKGKGKRAEVLDQLLAGHMPHKRTLIREIARHMARPDVAGRELVAASTIREIELSAKSIELNPHLNHWIMGGYPEVTIIFDMHGLRFKIRPDYLKIGSITDLKTIANEKGRAFEKAVDYAIAGNKYIVQPATYLPGAEIARDLIAAGKVFGAEGIDPAWLDLYAKTPVKEFRFIFQQKGMALVTEGAIYSNDDDELAIQGALRVRQGAETFKRYYEQYGAETPWISMNKPRHIDYASLPAFVNDL